MSQGSEAAEQMTREAIQISEAAAKLAALGAKNLAALCLALANENQKLRGKTHMNALLRSGKELRVFDLKEQDLTFFKQEAKKYGVLFSVIKDGANGNGHVDILAKAEDVSKLNRIFERLHYAAPEQTRLEDEPVKKPSPVFCKRTDPPSAGLAGSTRKRRLKNRCLLSHGYGNISSRNGRRRLCPERKKRDEENDYNYGGVSASQYEHRICGRISVTSQL